jgi:hypothetical protein
VAVALALLSAEIAPAAAVGNLAELLDVDMDQIARPFVLVATDRLSGGAVEVAESVESAADQDRVHGRGRHPQPVTDLDWSQALLAAQVHDLADHRCRGAIGLAVWP